MTFNVTIHKEWVFPVDADDEADAEQLALQYAIIEHASNTTVDVKRPMPSQLQAGLAKRLEQSTHEE